MNVQRLIKAEKQKQKDNDSEPVMVVIKMKDLNSVNYSVMSCPMPRGVFEMICNQYYEWESSIEMTHDQFVRYNDMLDDKKIEEAKKFLGEMK